MNNKMNIFAVVGIVTLSLLAIKPISNQVFGQTNETSSQNQPKCSSDLKILPDILIHTKVFSNAERLTTADIRGLLTCDVHGVGVGSSVGIGGARVSLSVISANCGHRQATTLTDENGEVGFFSFPLVVSPCTTPYRAEAHFPGDSANLPASAETEFSVNDETMNSGYATAGGPTSNNTK